LVVSQRGKIIYQREFKTSRGARIAFKKKYGKRNTFDKNIAKWSDFFSPDSDWVRDELSRLKPLESRMES